MNEKTVPNISQEALLKILEVTQKLATPLDLESILTEVVDAGKMVLNAERAALWLYDEISDELVLKLPHLDANIRIARGVGLVGECLNVGQVINVHDCRTDDRFNSILDESIGYTTKTLLNIPLISSDSEMIGVLQLLNKQAGIFDSQDEIIATSFAAQCTVALHRAQLTEELLEQKHLEEEVSVAREIQMSTLPSVMPVIDGYDIFGMFMPTDQTGGDMFDLVMLNEKLFILLGDATGHGFGPALSATQMQAMLRVAFRLGADLDAAFMQVNNQMVEDLPDDRFVTAFLGFLDPKSHKIQYHSGGQGPILQFSEKIQKCQWFLPTSFPLGAMEINGDPGKHQIHLQPGDILALISDGVYEYMDAEGNQFGEKRVGEFLIKNHHLPMAEFCKQLVAETLKYGGNEPQLDDITVVLIKRKH